MATTPAKPFPVHRLKIWPIEAAIWRNDKFYNVTLSRSYRDETGQYHDSGSFGRDDLLLAAKVLDAAHSWIVRKEAEDHKASQGGES